MFNELKSMLPNAVNILELWLALFFIVASTLVCIAIAKRLGRDLSALGRDLWLLTKMLLSRGRRYAKRRWKECLLCFDWRTAMIEHAHANVSNGIVWKFHRTRTNECLLGQGFSDAGKYLIMVFEEESPNWGYDKIHNSVVFLPHNPTAEQISDGIKSPQNTIYKNTFKLDLAEVEAGQIERAHYDVFKLIEAGKDALAKAEEHAEELYTRHAIAERPEQTDAELIAEWDWEAHAGPHQGNDVNQSYTCGGIDCHYKIRSARKTLGDGSFFISVALHLAVRGTCDKLISSTMEAVDGEQESGGRLIELENSFKIMARKRDDAGMDPEFDKADPNEPSVREYNARKAGEANSGASANSLEHIDADSKETQVVVKDADGGEITDGDQITVIFLSNHYNLSIQEVRQRLIADNRDIGNDNAQNIAAFGEVKALFEKPDWVPYDDLTAEFGAEALDTIPLNALTTKSNPNGKGWVYSRQETRKLLAEIKAKPEPESSVEHVDDDMREAGSLEMTGDGAGNLGEFGKDGERLIDQRDLPKLFDMSQEIIDLALQNESPDLQYFNTGGTSRRSLWSQTRVAKLLKTNLWANIPPILPLPEGAVKLNLTHDSLCSRHTLGQVFDLSIEEVKEHLGDTPPTNGDQQPTLYRFGSVLALFAGDTPPPLATNEVSSLMTQAELAVHFNVPVNLIAEVLDGVNPNYIAEMGKIGEEPEPQIEKWRIDVVEQLLANWEKTNDSTK